MASTSDQTFVVGIVGVPPTLDPHDQVLPTDYAVRITHDALLNPERDGSLTCRLAESYGRLEDDRWEFRLREGVRFASGRPVTAEAVKWNFHRMASDRRFAASTRMQTYADAEVVDAHTIRFETKGPDTAFPRRAVQVPIADPEEIGGDGLFPLEAVSRTGTGLYRCVEAEPGQPVRFVRNETSWRGEAPIARQELRGFNPQTMEEAFLADECHLGYVDEAGTERLIAAGIVCQRRPQANIHTLRFNSIVGPFADPKLRRALALAVDQEAIVREVYRGNGWAPTQLVGPDCFGYDPAMPPFETDPEEARRLLAETGFDDPLTIDVLESSAVLRYQGEAIARQLNAVGFKVEINYVDLKTYLGKMTRNTPRRSELIGAGNQWGPGLDADFCLDKFSGRLPDWQVEHKDDEYQAVYDRSLGEPDLETRRKLLQQCQRMLIADNACVPVWQPSLPWMVSPRVKGLDMNHFGAGWVDWLKVTMQ